MPQYEFANRETGESVGELFLSLEKMEDFLRQNPNLCVKPGKLRFMQHKSAESFPSYPDMNNETKCVEDRDPTFKPPEPASWQDENVKQEKYKITDKRKIKFSHFDEDIKRYGKITGTPKFLGKGETNFHVDKIDSDKPITPEEEDLFNQMEEAKDPQGQRQRALNMKGHTSKDPIDLPLDSGELMPWEAGFAAKNKDKYDSFDEDKMRIVSDMKREYQQQHPDED